MYFFLRHLRFAYFSGDMHLSFAGCGFIGLYHVGSASCIKTFAPFLLQNKIAGASAGAMAAAALIGEVSMADMAREVLKVVISASEKIFGPFNPVFSLNNMLKVRLTYYQYYTDCFLLNYIQSSGFLCKCIVNLKHLQKWLSNKLLRVISLRTIFGHWFHM